MRKTPAWRRYLRFLGSDPAADAQDELDFHLAMRGRIWWLAVSPSPKPGRAGDRRSWRSSTERSGWRSRRLGWLP